MAAKMKYKSQTNSPEDLTLSINEKILKECHTVYTDSENGLISFGETVGLKLLPPRKKITVMLIGNHSAGKSTFINWYIEEHVQKTGVAIETQGFTFITSGRKRESLTGNATLHVFPHFQSLQDIEGVVDYLSTEVSTSKQRKFSLITFIDTPGLVDGDMTYPFDVNYTINCLSELCDLVFVFFDPIGQALCKRTLDIVERVNGPHPEKLRFFLSKSDEAGHESDRQRVMMQIVQEVCKRPGLNKTCFDMPTIYIPNSNKQTRCVNQIEDTCKVIERTINHTVQSTLNQLEKDCDRISNLITNALSVDSTARSQNFEAKIKALSFSFLGFLLPILLLIQLIVASAPPQSRNAIFGEEVSAFLNTYLSGTTAFWEALENEHQLAALATTLVISGVCLILSRILGKTKPTLHKNTRNNLISKQAHLNEHIRPQKHKLYHEYLKQSVSQQDL